MQYLARQYAEALHRSLREAKGGEFSKRVKSFLSMLERYGALRLLPKILKEIEKLEIGQYAMVESTHAVPQRVIAEVQDALGVKRVEQKTTPGLLGGMVVAWNDWRIDGSVCGRLQQLKQKI